MAEARLADGQRLRAVNDLFVGPKTHSSALYELELNGQREQQSSSGMIISTGLGSTAWMKSIMTGAASLAHGSGLAVAQSQYEPMGWSEDKLKFAVREPFPSKSSQTSLVFGEIVPGEPLKVRSRMPENGVIFSDGIEADYLSFTAGMEAVVSVAKTKGQLVH